MSKHLIETLSGKFVFHIENGFLSEIDLPFNVDYSDHFDDENHNKRTSDIIDVFSDALDNFLTGNFSKIDFTNLSKYWNLPDSPFYAKVYKAVMKIEPGKTLSYKEVATECGNPNASRAVGGAMRNNPFPLLIPCHRVIGSNGSLTGYSGNKGLKIKQHLLTWEKESEVGVRFIF